LVLNKIFGIKEYSQGGFGINRGVVFLEGKTVNPEMVKAGYAKVYRGASVAGFDSAPK
jgi:endonuclease YncB( thermonuclease family)